MAIRFLALRLILFAFSGSCFSQEVYDSSGSERRWFIPDGVVMQYAGGAGMVSAGILYDVNPKTEFAFTVGYTPPEFGNITTFNLYGSYSLIKFVEHNFSFNILNAGVFVQTGLGENIYLRWPDRYPDRYYWWNSAIRFGPFFNSQISYTPKNQKIVYTVFLQCNTNDLYIATYHHSSKAIRLYDILVFGTGLKISFKE